MSRLCKSNPISHFAFSKLLDPCISPIKREGFWATYLPAKHIYEFRERSLLYITAAASALRRRWKDLGQVLEPGGRPYYCQL